MTTLTDIQTRVAQALEDPGGIRFSTVLLGEAVRLALDTLDQRLPRLLTSEIAIDAGGREVLLPGLTDCLYLVGLRIKRGDLQVREMEPESEFSYQFEGEQMRLHFSGKRTPRSGDVLVITFAAGHSLQGLDGAATTTLPAAYESALVNGAAGHACLLHATKLAETYGTRPNETARLIEISQLRLNEFAQSVGNLKVLQEFGFPPGFRLEGEDLADRGRW
jgi:hypothetical protein